MRGGGCLPEDCFSQGDGPQNAIAPERKDRDARQGSRTSPVFRPRF